MLFEYQKFNHNNSLQQKIDDVNDRYFSNVVELDDTILDVSAAGETNSSKSKGGRNVLNASGENGSDNALETLSEREKEIVILHYYDGLKHIEISKKLGLSYTSERQICHVAIKKLRKEIEKNL